MKLFINNSDIDVAYPQFMRLVGYTYIESRHTGKGSFVRAMANSGYPRFHVYVDDLGDKFCVNLHLDQKRPSYEGTSAHSGEYDGPTVEAEIDRIKSFAAKGSGQARPGRSTPSPSSGDARSQRFSNLIHNM